MKNKTSKPRLLARGLLAAVLFAVGSQWPVGAANAQPAQRSLLPVDMTYLDYVKTSKSEFVDPPKLHADEGIAKLDVGWAINKIGPHLIKLRSYNGSLVGPTLRVRRGQVLQVRLSNSLPAEDAKPQEAHKDTNYPHGFNTTNLHVHGLHVSPNDKSDNVFLSLAPKQEPILYTFAIDKDHPAGTFWYHAHLHGSTAMQVASGMGGALIVESGKDEAPGPGNLDPLPGIKQAAERILVFQQIPYRIDEQSGIGSVEEKDVYYNGSDPPAGANQATLINGVLAPVIKVRPGAVERWRMIHAGIQASLKIKIERAPENKGAEKPTLSEIAVDGLAKHRSEGEMRQGGGPKPESDAFLQPGNRSDILVFFPKGAAAGDTYYLYTDKIRADADIKGRAQPKQYLARIVIEGQGVKGRTPIPDVDELEKCAAFARIEKVAEQNKRELEFVWKKSGKDPRNGKPIQIGSIGGKPFNPADAVPKKEWLVLDVPVEWEILADGHLHPFHIHTNSFEVLKYLNEDAAEPFDRQWRDTVAMSEADKINGFVVKVRICPKKFTGETVMHCHNLHHEDHGMMLKVKYVAKEEVKEAVQERPAGGFAALPAKAPAWQLTSTAKKSHQLKDYAGKDLLLVLYLGGECPHCVDQLRLLAERKSRFDKAGLAVLAVSAGSVKAGKAQASEPAALWPFPLLSDPQRQVFQAYGCLGAAPLHGTFLIDAQGQVRWQHVGPQPFTELDQLLQEHARWRK